MPERLLPFNTSPLEQALEQVVAERLEAIPLPLASLWNPEQCPSALLPWLAWALSIDAWNSDWPNAIKRSVIAGSMAQHRHKGTVASVRQALNDVGVDVEIEEWFQYHGKPYTFRLVMDAVANWLSQGQPLTPLLFHHIRELIHPVKPVRSHYTTRIKIGAENHLGLANKGSQFTLLRLRLPFLLQFTNLLGAAASVVSPIVYVARAATFTNSSGLSLLAPLHISTPLQAVISPRIQGTLRLTPQALPTQTAALKVPTRAAATQTLSATVRL